MPTLITPFSFATVQRLISISGLLGWARYVEHYLFIVGLNRIASGEVGDIMWISLVVLSRRNI
jgi:hypothetical protein